MPTQRVAIAGATGYAGEELIRLLLTHPQVQLTSLAASAKWDRPQPVCDVYPRFTGRLDLPIESLNPSRLAQAADTVFLALPHGTAMDVAPPLLKAGVRVIDLSGDFRLRDPALYPRWYACTHRHPELLTDGRVAYGLTEFHREAIQRARLIANPGCYATSILLAVLPLLRAGVMENAQLIVDAKSGLTGAGRKADPALLFTEMTDNVRAYKVNDHPHMPEVLQEIAQVTGREVRMVFVPQIIPATRGLLSTIYVQTSATAATLREAYEACYPAAQAPFVRVREGIYPAFRDVVGTNDCAIGFTVDAVAGYAILLSALDNLTKGAAGQAVQNLNVMMGWPEAMGLR